MTFQSKHLFSKNNLLVYGAFALLLPALLINLGLLAFYDDEGIRALVALEMKLSGSYITPTFFGEFYYNKPPLYNWILLLFFELTGRTDEFIARLPTVFFLLAYAGTVYYFFQAVAKPTAATHEANLSLRDSQILPSGQPIYPFGTANLSLRDSQPRRGKQPTTNSALLSAFALITCGRILFWDSMLALIDICFSWVMFTMFMVIYRDGERGRFGRMFVLAYLLAAIGFMLKGLPAAVFLGIALLTWLFWQKKGQLLFSWLHARGMAVFALMVGSYYGLYARHNGLAQVFKTLFDESAKRTFVEYGAGQTVQHFFTFPFEMWYHFLPWTLLAVYFFRKNAWRLIRQNKFITWNLLIFLTTILPYWSSVEVYPRYLFMHVPLLFSAFFYLHFKNREEGAVMSRVVEMVFFVLCLAALVASLSLPFLKLTAETPFLHLKAFTITALLALLGWLYWRWQARRLLVFVLVLLVARIGFNWFLLPSRLQVECSTMVRETTLDAVKKAGSEPLYIYEYSLGFQPITGYYFTRETGRILRPVYKDFDKNALYIINPKTYHPDTYEEVTRFRVKWECGELVLGRLNERMNE